MAEEVGAAANVSPTDIKQDATEELASFRVPSLAVNRFYGLITASGVRLAFAERIPGTTTSMFRTAVTCSVADARELRTLLQYLLSRADLEASPEPETND